MDINMKFWYILCRNINLLISKSNKVPFETEKQFCDFATIYF